MYLTFSISTVSISVVRHCSTLETLAQACLLGHRPAERTGRGWIGNPPALGYPGCLPDHFTALAEQDKCCAHARGRAAADLGAGRRGWKRGGLTSLRLNVRYGPLPRSVHVVEPARYPVTG